MGRGVSSGGGQSSLGYLFGSGEAPKMAEEKAEFSDTETKTPTMEPCTKQNAAPQPVPVNASKQIAAGIQSSTVHNYFNGQNTCNFISDRPSTKIQAAPGGGSSLGYLFGDGSN